jgi:hypothetical protein
MKKKFEIFLEAYIATLNYLDNHKIQGRILFTGISAFLIILSLKIVSSDLIKIIQALK